MHYLPASLLPWPPGCIQRLLPCKRCRVGPCCTSPKPTQSVRSPLRDWHEARLAYLQQPESRARTIQGPRRSMTLSTSFKCSAIRVPLRRCNSSDTRARHSARQASAALPLMRLPPLTKTHQPRPLIHRRVVTYKMVPGILCARTGQKTTNKYVMVPIVYRPD